MANSFPLDIVFKVLKILSVHFKSAIMVYIWRIIWQELIKMDLGMYLTTFSEKSAWADQSLMPDIFSDLHCKNLELWSRCAHNSCGDGGNLMTNLLFLFTKNSFQKG